MSSSFPNEINHYSSQETPLVSIASETDQTTVLQGVFPGMPNEVGSLANRVSIGLAKVSEKDQLLELLRTWNPECEESEKAEISDLILDCYNHNAQTLSISCSTIRSMPEVFFLSGFQNLTDFYLENCPSLLTIPESVRNLTALEVLSFDNCQSLVNVPEGLGDLRSLEVLSLNGCNSLTTLPETIGSLGSLSSLSLEDCISLSTVPMKILELSNDCVVDLIGCSISESLIESLNMASRCEDYNGPEIRFFVPQEHDDEDRILLDELLVQTFMHAEMEAENLSNLWGLNDSQKQIIATWLNRMRDTADAGPNHITGFYRVIINHLKLADVNEDFRKIFLQILHEASRTCGDRVSLSVLHLGVAARKMTCDKKDLKAYAELLKGLIALDLLEQVARAKFESMPLLDEIEVYLGYPVKLKEELNLPIDIHEMRFFGCSGITQEDLSTAKAFVLATIDNQEAFLAHLIKNEDWVTALKANYPELFLEIERAREEASDSDDPDYVAIGQIYDQALIELSRTALA